MLSSLDTLNKLQFNTVFQETQQEILTAVLGFTDPKAGGKFENSRSRFGSEIIAFLIFAPGLDCEHSTHVESIINSIMPTWQPINSKYDSWLSGFLRFPIRACEC